MMLIIVILEKIVESGDKFSRVGRVKRTVGRRGKAPCFLLSIQKRQLEDQGKTAIGQETDCPKKSARCRRRSSETAKISGKGGFRATV